MKEFQHQDVGLFTFYRQQAQYEQEKQRQKRQKALQRQLRLQQQQRKRIQLSEQKKKLKQIKRVSPSPVLQTPKESLTQRAKKYLKQLQQSGPNKLMYDHKRRQRRYNNIGALQNGNEKIDITISLNPLEKADAKDINSMGDIFMKKKDYSKFNYYMLFDKQAVAPKQFNSVEIFQLGAKPADLRDRQFSQDLLKRRSVGRNTESLDKKTQSLLPQLNNSSRPFPSPIVPIYKRQKDRKQMHYNPINIILNNQKFKIKQLTKMSRQPPKHDESSPNKPGNGGADSVLQLIKKYRMIK